MRLIPWAPHRGSEQLLPNDRNVWSALVRRFCCDLVARLAGLGRVLLSTLSHDGLG
jgi:hypothetical protein